MSIEKSINLKSSDYSALNIKSPKIRSLEENKSRQLLIGTRSSDIIIMDENGVNPKIIMRGHFNEKLSGLTTHPKLPEIVTCGEDCLLSVWNTDTKK
jgi:hypothetical protein